VTHDVSEIYPSRTEACLKNQTLTGQCHIFSTLKLEKSSYSSSF
jgi:hypothetical protein